MEIPGWRLWKHLLPLEFTSLPPQSSYNLVMSEYYPVAPTFWTPSSRGLILGARDFSSLDSEYDPDLHILVIWTVPLFLHIRWGIHGIQLAWKIRPIKHSAHDASIWESRSVSSAIFLPSCYSLLPRLFCDHLTHAHLLKPLPLFRWDRSPLRSGRQRSDSLLQWWTSDIYRKM